MKVLAALERNDAAQVPHGLFTRAFVRAYAAEVGLDPDLIAEQYASEMGNAELDCHAEFRALQRRYAKPSRLAGQVSYLLAIAIGAGPLIYGVNQSKKDLITNATSHLMPVIASNTVSPRVLTQSFAVRHHSVGHATAIELDIRTDGYCWVSARVDGQLVVERLLSAGDSLALDARRQIVLRVGDAGSFTYWINGERGRPLGESGEVVQLEITASNYNDFLVS